MIRILGKGNNEIGDLFTHLMASVLEQQGYETVGLDVQGTGYEIDIRTKHKLDGHPLYAECKAHQRPMAGDDITKFYGVYTAEHDKDPRCTGMFFSLSGFNGPAKALYESMEPGVRERFRIFDGDDILRAMQDADMMCSRDLARHLMRQREGNLDVTRLEVAYSKHGLSWLVVLTDQGKESHFTFLDAQGEALHDDIVVELAACVEGLQPLEPWRPPTNLAEQKEAYLRRVAEHFEWVDLAGLAPQVGGELLRLRLDAVFVHLYAEQDVPLADTVIQEQLRLQRTLDDEGVSSQEAQREDGPVGMARQQREAARGERVQATETARRQRVVLLGDPGSGKTTLVRYIARGMAVGERDLPASRNLLPVYVQLGEYDRHCEDQAVALMDYFPIAARARGLPLSGELLDHEASRGKCIFLLDGLDEIVNPGRRGQIRDRIQDLVRSHAKCHIVVTSRVVGYRAAQLPSGDGGFHHFTLCSFDDDEIAQFVTKWYEAIAATGDVTDPARQNARTLTEGICGNPSVRGLATNPLLMTLIALMYWREVRLPRRRFELYRDASRTLLSTWLQTRTPQIELSEKEATALLMAVAFHMHETSSSGLICRPELERGLFVQLTDPRRGRLSELEAHREIGRFLRTVGEHVGLLYARGYDDRNREVFGFLHLTFEEYFAARELARLWRKDQAKLGECLHLPRWEEPIRLASAHLSDEDDDQASDGFVRQILMAHSPYDNALHRDLLLAARCLSDDAYVYRDLVKTIFARLDEVFSTSVRPLNDQIVAILASMRGSRVWSQAHGIALRKLASRNGEVSMAAARAIKELRRGDDDNILKPLMAHLCDEDRTVQCHAAEALGKLGDTVSRPDVVMALVRALHDRDPSVRLVTAAALGNMAETAVDGEVIRALLEGLEDQYASVVVASARSLGNMGARAARPYVMSCLIVQLVSSDPDVRSAAACAFRDLCRAATQVGSREALLNELEEICTPALHIDRSLKYLLDTVSDPEALIAVFDQVADEDPDMSAAEFIAFRDLLGFPNRSGREGVLIAELAHDLHAYPQTLFDSARNLAATDGIRLAGLMRHMIYTADQGRYVDRIQRLAHPTGTTSGSAVLGVLLDSLIDKDPGLRGAVAEALDMLWGRGATDLLTNHSTHNSPYVRWLAVQALGTMGESAATADVTTALIHRLGDPDPSVRATAAMALASLGNEPCRADVVEALTNCLTDPKERVRVASARALSTAAQSCTPPHTTGALVHCLHDGNASVRAAAAEALEALGLSGRPEVLARLAARLLERDPHVWVTVASATGAPGATPDALMALASASKDSDRHVRQAAADALRALGRAAASPDILLSLASTLADSDWRVRRAAAQALGAMGQPACRDEVLTGLTELLRDSDKDVRDAAARALRELGEGAGKPWLVEALLERIERHDGPETTSFIEVLGALGPAAASDRVMDRLAEMVACRPATAHRGTDTAFMAMQNLAQHCRPGSYSQTPQED